ncbi:OmpA family protein [Corallincola holothuriorum]|uniref:OmpA family protein n=2 Tax=Corallincola holothuriorum TaxID=2282215 RepID=A0A368NR12_9GAMM|nr:OmpA family protein [Corallincola holothuriorum]
MTMRLHKGITVVAGCLLATSVVAEELNNMPMNVGASLRYAAMDGDRQYQGSDYDDGLLGGLSFGMDPWEEIGLRLRAEYADMDVEGGKDDDGMWYAADALFYFNEKKHYIITGLDYIDLDDSNTAVHLGIGGRHFFNDAVAMSAELIAHQGIDESFTDFTVGFGLAYYFGTQAAVEPTAAPEVAPEPEPEPEPVVVVAPKDSDGDGVYDADDQCADTPASYAVDERGCTLYKDEVVSKTLLVNFDNNKADVKDEYLPEIEELAEFMNQYPQLTVTIEGHTSSAGAADYNQQLSEKRAKAVAAELVERYSVPASRVSTVGYGETKPLSTENSKEAAAANRRIVATLTVVEKKEIER